MNNRETLIWLNSMKEISNTTIDKLEKYYGNINTLWEVSNDEINKLTFISDKIKSVLIKNKCVEYYNNHIEKINELDIDIITIYDENYPDNLKNIYNYPKVLYVKGNILEKDRLSISIVGSRKATAYGKWATEKFSRELGELGITIISGMALGIDTIAHMGAINGSGRTLAVLGSGVNVIYPKRNRELYNKIYNNGAIISEFPPDTKPLPYNFPQRNRIISGLSLGTVVIEASEKSGSLITAHSAIEQGRDVFALPGNINSIYSKGTNLLIKDGATPLMDIEDILEEIIELNNIKNNKKVEEINLDEFSEDEIKIIRCIREKPIHCDMIAYNCNMNISKVNSILTILEMKGIIKQLQGKIFTMS